MKLTEQMLEEKKVMNTSVSFDDNLNEKLELYRKYSNDIKAFEEEKSDLESLIAGVTDRESISIKMSGLNYQIIQGNNMINELKITIADLIGSSTELFTYLGMIQKEFSKKFASEINARMVKIIELRKNLKSALVKEIAGIYAIKQENITGENKRKGIQEGFVVNDTSTGLKLYVKKSKIIWNDLDSVDPRELFAYKVLEYMEMGPEARFIFTSSPSYSDGPKKCHIVTKDVAYSNYKNIKNVFFTDNLISKEDGNMDAIEHWEKSLSNKEFRAKFITLSLVNDLLHLNDTLGGNALNYGSMIQYKMDEPQYYAILIDHEVRNSLFKYEPDKHPVMSLMKKLEFNARDNKHEGELISYKIIKDKGWFIDEKQIKSELREAINAVNEKFQKIVKVAEDEIRDIMSKFNDSFSESACKRLEEYLTQTEINIEKFNKIKNNYIDNSEETNRNMAS